VSHLHASERLESRCAARRATCPPHSVVASASVAAQCVEVDLAESTDTGGYSSQTQSQHYSVSQKSPLRFSDIFSQTDENFVINFTHLLYVPFYTRLQILIQLIPTLTKLCHTKRDNQTNFYISLEV